MADHIIILLPEYRIQQSGLVNQFLIDTGLSEELRVVLAEYEEEVELSRIGTLDKVVRKKTVRCLGLEALNEKAAFYWNLKGNKEIMRRLKDYDT